MPMDYGPWTDDHLLAFIRMKRWFPPLTAAFFLDKYLAHKQRSNGLGALLGGDESWPPWLSSENP